MFVYERSLWDGGKKGGGGLNVDLLFIGIALVRSTKPFHRSILSKEDHRKMLFRDEIKLGYDLLTLFYLFIFFLGGGCYYLKRTYFLFRPLLTLYESNTASNCLLNEKNDGLTATSTVVLKIHLKTL